MADLTLTPEDRQVIKDILLTERARGVKDPLLAADTDIDGDGVTDAFGLDDDGEVMVVTGVNLGATTYVSEGFDDVEGGKHVLPV